MNMQAANLKAGGAVDTRPWYGQLWPWLLMLGPFLVVLAGGYTSWLAYTRQDALVVGDYYKQGKAINQDLRRDRVAARMGLSLRLSHDPAGGRIAGRVAGERTPPPQSVMTLRLAHSTQPEKDVTLTITPDETGAFSAPLPMLERARWQVLLEDEARSWRLAGVWQWPQQRGITINAEL
jgi:hypothetical protein